jgi:hypothetical protein
MSHGVFSVILSWGEGGQSLDCQAERGLDLGALADRADSSPANGKQDGEFIPISHNAIQLIPVDPSSVNEEPDLGTQTAILVV